MIRSVTLAALLLLPACLGAQSAAAPESQPAAHEPKEWAVPFGAKTRPRDPYADDKGRVWFVGQQGNYVAYVDSRTQQFRRYEIEPGTHPHNLATRIP